MTSPQQSKTSSRFVRLLGFAALAVGGAIVGTCTANALRKDRHHQTLSGSSSAEAPIPGELGTADSLEDADLETPVTTSAAATEEAEPEVKEDPAPAAESSLETRTVGELYELAQQHDIAGRSNMRKADLIRSLRDAGISETAPEESNKN